MATPAAQQTVTVALFTRGVSSSLTKKTGARRFEVDAAGNGNMPIDKAASLLAIQCVARQQMPQDFGVMVMSMTNPRPAN